MQLPFRKGVEIYRWGPIPGRYFFPSDFTYPFTLFNRRYAETPWPDALFLFDHGRMVFMGESPPLIKSGSKAFHQYVLPDTKRKEVYQSFYNSVQALDILHKEVTTADLKGLTDIELSSLWEKVREEDTQFWIPALLLELANYGSPNVLEKAVTPFIKHALERSQAMEVLTSPEVPSFYQEEEIELSEIDDIKAHQQKWFWLKNSYHDTQILDIDFFAKRKAELNAGIRERIEDHIVEVQQKKEALIKQYALSSDVVKIAEQLWKGVAWQDERKKYIFMHQHYKVLMLQEIAQRFHFASEDLFNLGIEEISEMLDGKDQTSLVEKRRFKFGFRMSTKLTPIFETEAIQYWQLYGQDQVAHSNILTGIVASRGRDFKVRGFVTILHNPHALDQFPEDGILVAPMTSPEYVFAMKKARAVITDTGGLTSHAAIVSRELRVPCLVGTKGATQLLHNGDLVEVDTDGATVTIIKRA